MRRIFLFLSFFLTYSLTLSTQAADNQPSLDPETLHLSGRFCFGADNLDMFGFSPLIRFWVNENTAFEGLEAANSYRGSEIALGIIQNLAHPTRDLFIHFLGRLTTGSFEGNPETHASATLGLGFEAFAPFCENLSVDGWVGEEFSINIDYQTVNFSATQLQSSLPSPIGLAIHCYIN